jgi:hypothetical protein
MRKDAPKPLTLTPGLRTLDIAASKLKANGLAFVSFPPPPHAVTSAVTQQANSIRIFIGIPPETPRGARVHVGPVTAELQL